MIKEMYCSYELSKLLKEKGFDEECYQKYDGEGYLSFNHVGYINAEKPNEDFSALAPTHQMAMAWLREKYGIFIAINNDDLDFNWQCFDLINRGSTLDPKILSSSYGGFKHYEDAVEAACLYALNNLI